MGRSKVRRAVELGTNDASMVFHEGDNAVANMVSVTSFDARQAAPDHATVTAWISERLDCHPIFHRVLKRGWKDFAPPRWVDAGDYDIGEHVSVVEAENWLEVSPIVARLAQERMDLSRPPWHVTVINGVRGLGARYAEVSTLLCLQFHHCMGDGPMFVDLVYRMMLEPPVPDSEVRRGRTRAAAYGAVPRDYLRYLRAVREVRKAPPPPSPAELVPSRFTQKIQGLANIRYIDFDFQQFRNARAAVPGATINDILLSIIAGATARIIEELGDSLDGPMTTLMPIQVEDLVGGATNTYAMGVLELHGAEPDPVRRLAAIHASASAEKDRLRSPVFATYRNFEAAVPIRAISVTADAVREARATPEACTLSISNVRGRDQRQNFMGALSELRLGVPSIRDGSLLKHAATSYEGRLVLSYIADPVALPDPERYSQLIIDELHRLLGAMTAESA